MNMFTNYISRSRKMTLVFRGLVISKLSTTQFDKHTSKL